MPESPEVQALARFLASEASGRAIRGVDVLEFRTVKTRVAPPGRRRRPHDHRGGATRQARGAASSTTGRLVVSLGRHGWMRWVARTRRSAAGGPTMRRRPSPPSSCRGDIALQVTDAGSWVSLGLWVVDDRRRGARDRKARPGPRRPGLLTRRLRSPRSAGRRKQIKAILQEQESLAGIGNAYSDEILHAREVSPVTHAAALDADATRSALRETIGVVGRRSPRAAASRSIS